jgi:hypothetical protein
MPFDSIYSEETKIWAKNAKGIDNNAIYKAWREEWKRKGIVEFAFKILAIDPKNGGELKLSEDQIQFLIDVSTGKTKFAIISAGRGTGKSFSLSILIAYMIFVNEFFHISVLAGNAKQSGILDEYIKGWIRNNKKLESFCTKNVEAKIITSSNSGVTFCALSDTAVRGIHGSMLIVDEEVAAENAGGEQIVKTAEWQVNTSKNISIVRSSTPNSASGYFIETWNEWKEHGYTRYRWSSARHISGETNPYKIFEDTNPDHWFNILPWVPSDDNIRMFRRGRSNGEFLAEALGTVSLSSGLVIDPKDLEEAICKECDECTPYQGTCILLQYYLIKEGYQKEEIIPPDFEEMKTPEGIRKNEETIRKALQVIGERVIGIDWGDKAPDCYSCIGKFNNQNFILDSKELRGQGTEEKIGTTKEMADKWFVETIVPDPEQWAYSDALSDIGYTVIRIWNGGGGADKQKFVFWLKKDFERQRIHIPKAFIWLIKSLRELTYGDNEKIVKRNDHSFDSLLYGRSYYGEIEEDEIKGLKAAFDGVKIWNKEAETQNNIPVAPKKISNKTNEEIIPIEEFNPFDEDYLYRKKKQSDGFDSGVNIW